jgi:hypothetical protein
VLYGIRKMPPEIYLLSDRAHEAIVKVGGACSTSR